jgi:hypothetical protein
VIEHFRPGRASEVYRRFRERGRMAPEGVRYVSSWVDLDDVFDVDPVAEPRDPLAGARSRGDSAVDRRGVERGEQRLVARERVQRLGIGRRS